MCVCVGVREWILVVVTQCLRLLTKTHHSYTTHSVSLVWGGGGGRGVGAGGIGGGGVWGRAGERERWEGDPSRSCAVSAPADTVFASHAAIK